MKEAYIKQLIRILQESKVDSLEISSFWGMSKIKLSKNSNLPKSLSTSYSNSPKEDVVEIKEKPIQAKEEVAQSVDNIPENSFLEQSTENQASEDNIDYITAPLVGTYYTSPKPDDPPFIKKGDRVEVGQTICIIEAMKIFNEIEAEISGVVEEILIDDGAPVEYGQKIIAIILDD